MNLNKVLIFFGSILIILGILLNRVFFELALSIPDIPSEKAKLLLIYNIGAIITGIVIILKSKGISSILSNKKKEISLFIGSVIFAMIIFEIILRICLFNPSCDVPLVKDPNYYANSLDVDSGYYSYIFNKFEFDINSNEFYRNWSLSLEPNIILGHSRKRNVQIPCHETTNLGTRGLKNYTIDGKKIVFFGDSWVESKSCSDDTITSKIEKKTGLDTLNYGVGGYGLDQIFLSFSKTFSLFNDSENIFLVGMILDDLNRVVLEAMVTSKPYFTIEDDELRLHTAHIDTTSLESYYENYKPKQKIYILNLIFGKLGIRDVWNTYIKKTHDGNIRDINSLILKEFKGIEEDNDLNLYFVIFYFFNEINSNDWRIDYLKSQFEINDLKVIDTQECLLKSKKRTGLPAYEIIYDHPTSIGNEILSDCIIGRLSSDMVLQKNVTE